MRGDASRSEAIIFMDAKKISSKDMIRYLRSWMTPRRGPKHPHGIDPWIFWGAATIAIAFVAWGIFATESLGSFAQSALDFTINKFGWLFVMAASAFVIFIVAIAFSRFGRIPLGKDGEKPRFKTRSWIAMMFSAGMGIGLMFYGVAEPLFFYMAPPPNTVDPESARAAATALGTAAFHWTIYPWAMYAIVGLGSAYGAFRLGRSQLFSSMFAGLFGPRVVHGAGGRFINILAVIATLFGSACSLGLGALQVGGGLQSAGLVDGLTSAGTVAIIAVLTACFLASAVSGLERGIQLLSNTNMFLAIALAVIVFVAGPMLFVLNLLPNTLGTFIQQLPQMAGRTAASGGADVAAWMSSWTIFYWAWWISWTPFVGLFIGRISRGRTVRGFVAGALLVPSIASTLWFAVFGGGAIGLQQRAEASGRNSLVKPFEAGKDIDFNSIFFTFLEHLPLPSWLIIALIVLTIILIAIFFVTGADSASIVMAGLSENGAAHPSGKNVAFWGLATGSVASIMLLAGGNQADAALQGLKNITIVTALPFVIVLLILCLSIWVDLRRDPLIVTSRLANQLLEESVAEGVMRHDGEPFRLGTRGVPADHETPALAPAHVNVPVAIAAPVDPETSHVDDGLAAVQEFVASLPEEDQPESTA